MIVLLLGVDSDCGVERLALGRADEHAASRP